MSLLELPVELQREIYSYILCPGSITIRRLRSGCIQCHPFTRQRSGRIPEWSLKPSISTHSSAAEAAVCKQLDTALARYLVNKTFRTSSRFLAYQLGRLLNRHASDRKLTVVDCSPRGLNPTATIRAKALEWCPCQTWPIYTDSQGIVQARHRCLREMILTQGHRQDQKDKPNKLLDPPALEMALLSVCREVYTVARDMMWEENVFHFEVQEDFESFLGMLSERQRSKLKKVQIVAEVLVMLG